MTPILKWAGGKTQLLNYLIGYMPICFHKYYEPFCGGAALLLCFGPSRAHINDINEQLINLYRQIKEDVDTVIAKVNELDSIPCTKTLYYYLREQYNSKIASKTLDAECAALMIWLNKHCYNGLYRVNLKGLFNVPYNNDDKNKKSIDENNLRNISAYLRYNDITITCQDFKEACKDAKKGDFVYFDSPYVPISDTSSFVEYTPTGFNAHERLAKLYRELDSKGVQVMLSNNDVPIIRELYVGYPIISVPVRRHINRSTSKEVIIINYN